MKISLIILNLIFLNAFQTFGQGEQNNYAELTPKIDSIINVHNFNGVISLFSDTVNIYSKAVGYSDLKNKTRLNLNDQFVIGSISKQITTVLILREYEKGKIGLSDTIGKYLTEIKQPWVREITVHQLLTHTHGIVDVDKSLQFKPGAQFQYSQLGYELLAQILESVSGKSFEELSTELFGQFGLKNTFHPNNNKYENLVKSYEENENGVLEYAEHSLENYAAAGSFISNAQDLIRWNVLLHSEKLVRKETLELMKVKYAARIHPIFGTVEYGYGLIFKDGEQNIQIGALGYAPGFVSASYYHPQTNLNLVILENTAKKLHDFRQTFSVHTEIMELIKRVKHS